MTVRHSLQLPNMTATIARYPTVGHAFREGVRKGIARAGRAIGLIVQQHCAFAGPVNAEYQIAQRRLAGAVLAQQAVHLAAPQRDVDAGKRLERAKKLADSFHRKQRDLTLIVASGTGTNDCVHDAAPRPQPSSNVIVPALMSSIIWSSFSVISGVGAHTAMPEASGPIARPNGL